MFRNILVFTAILAVLSCVSAQSSNSTRPNLKWGPVGHSVTAYLAQNMLNANANAAVQKILADYGGDMSKVASWADQVRRELHWSGPLHYINTPDWDCSYHRTRDCADMICVDGAIQNYTKILSSSRHSLADQTEALKFLIHFLGDIHQPLHVGFSSDEGGNTIIGTFFTKSNQKLHAIWDSEIVQRRIDLAFNSDEQSYFDYLNSQVTGAWASKVSKYQTCSSQVAYNACSEDWAQETIGLACTYAYVDYDGTTHMENGFVIDDQYYDRVAPIMEQQFVKGGARLASILNALFP